MSPRVALDVTPELFAATGVARYSHELARALERRDDCDVVRFAIGRRSLGGGEDRVRHLPVPLRLVHPLWRRVPFPKAEQLVGHVDLVHSLDLVAPPTKKPLVVTVHDLAAIEQPALHPSRTVAMQRRRLAEMHRAAAIVTVSRATADALAEHGVDPARTYVTPLGLTPLPPPGRLPVGAGRFVLAVGTLEPRKAHDVLLTAFARTELPSDVRVVFAGPSHGRDDALWKLARELGIGERVEILGAVPDAELSALYRAAEVLCMPSLEEGFGLPVLEAMSVGLPVVASDIAALREVGGDCAVYASPGDADALATALSSLLGDPDLQLRLASAGAARAGDFTWEATAAETVRAYERALEGL